MKMIKNHFIKGISYGRRGRIPDFQNAWLVNNNVVDFIPPQQVAAAEQLDEVHSKYAAKMGKVPEPHFAGMGVCGGVGFAGLLRLEWHEAGTYGLGGIAPMLPHEPDAIFGPPRPPKDWLGLLDQGQRCDALLIAARWAVEYCTITDDSRVGLAREFLAKLSDFYTSRIESGVLPPIRHL
jgi:hypothetical protein